MVSTARIASRLVLGALVMGGCPGDGSDGSGEPATTTMTAPPGGTEQLPTSGDPSGDPGGDPTEDPTADPTDTATGGEPALDPGRVTIHRLNRSEYNNTVRDLLGTSQRPADNFPADDFGLGFDNIADVLSTSPLQGELYERAAEALIAEAMAIPITEPTRFQIEAETALSTVGASTGDGWNLYSNGEVYTTIELPYDGKYTFEARVYGQQAGPDLPHMNLTVDQLPVGMFDVEAVQNGAQKYSVEIDATAGLHKFAVEFTNDFYDPDASADRNLVVDWFAVEGPKDLISGENPQRTRIMICDPVVDGEAQCGRDVLAAFARRAWRRPATADEVERLYQIVAGAKASGQDFETGLRVALQAVLVSPYFVFRVELDPDPTGLDPHPLSDHELASRLSYFLWSSMPDDALLAAADQGTLSDPDVLVAEARRLLEDPRAHALVDNFTGQWWLIRNVSVAFKDVVMFPEWNDAMKQSMRRELELLAASFVLADRDMREMLTTTRSFVDQRLASHYGLAGQFSDDFVEVDFADQPFRGVLMRAGLMTVLSHAARTSAVKRGKWVLESLLCQSPPPPPPGVDTALPTGEGKTQREILEAHREDPKCIGCHVAMDPLGFGLEHYGPLGQWRDLDNGLPIDPSGTLPNGLPFADGLEMTTLISEEPGFVECVARKTMIYALGRNTGVGDLPYLQDLYADFATGEYQFSDLVVALVTSDVFRQRRGDPSM